MKHIIRTIILLVTLMLSATNVSWGQTYYVFKYDGHYLAHNGYTTDGSEICEYTKGTVPFV